MRSSRLFLRSSSTPRSRARSSSLDSPGLRLSARADSFPPPRLAAERCPLPPAADLAEVRVGEEVPRALTGDGEAEGSVGDEGGEGVVRRAEFKDN